MDIRKLLFISNVIEEVADSNIKSIYTSWPLFPKNW